MLLTVLIYETKILIGHILPFSDWLTLSKLMIEASYRLSELQYIAISYWSSTLNQVFSLAILHLLNSASSDYWLNAMLISFHWLNA